MKNLLKILAVNLVLIIIVLVIGEAAARMISSSRHLKEGNQYVFFEFDPELGWTGKKSVKGDFKRGDQFNIKVSQNSHGMRDDEIPIDKPDGEFRIAILGDSFSWGFGVENKDNYSEVLQSYLGPGVEVMNFGISGYGRGQQWLQLKRDVLPFSPDAVIIMAYPGNDLIDNVSPPENEIYPRPYFALDDSGRLLTLGQPVIEAKGEFEERLFMQKTGKWMRFYLRSHLFRAVYHAFNAIQHSWEQEPGQYLLEVFDVEKLPELRKQMQVEKQILREIRSLTEEKGVPLLFAIAAIPEQIKPGLQRKISASHPERKIDWDQPSKLLVQAAQAAGVEALDLRFLLAPYEQAGPSLHFEKDFHWNVYGNKTVADSLLPWAKRVLDAHRESQATKEKDGIDGDEIPQEKVR